MKSRRTGLLQESCLWSRDWGIGQGREHQDSVEGEKVPERQVGEWEGKWEHGWWEMDTGEGIGIGTVCLKLNTEQFYNYNSQ